MQVPHHTPVSVVYRTRCSGLSGDKCRLVRDVQSTYDTRHLSSRTPSTVPRLLYSCTYSTRRQVAAHSSPLESVSTSAVVLTSRNTRPVKQEDFYEVIAYTNNPNAYDYSVHARANTPSPEPIFTREISISPQHTAYRNTTSASVAAVITS